jgi:DNA primase
VLGQETIEQVRRQTSLVAVVQQSVRLQRRGRSYVGLCPFHQEKTPSFHVNEERGFYHCFGCKASGDAIRFVQETQGVSFVQAVRDLADRAGIVIVEQEATAEDARQRAEARRKQQELYDVGNAAAVFFEQALRDHPLSAIARAELARRTLVPTSPTDSIADALQAFRVGYAPYGWDELARHLRSLGLPSQAAESAGLIVPRKSGGGHYDRFRHRLMFAVLDLQAKVVAFSGRCLPEPTHDQLRQASIEATRESTAEAAKAKYINSPESPIYKKRETVFGLFQARQALRDAGQALLVEGNFDVVSLHARGIRNAVAPLGTAFTAEQATLIKRLAPEVVLLFDGDTAGRRAASAAREAVRAADLLCRVASLPDGVDPDELVRRGGVEAVRYAVQSSRGILEYLIDSCLDGGFTVGDALARAARIKRVAEILSAETDPEVRAMAEGYADQVAERLGISDARTFRVLASRIRRALTKDSARAAASHKQQACGPKMSDPVGLEVLGCILDWPDLLADPDLEPLLDYAEGDVAAALALARRAFLGQIADAVEVFLAKVPRSIHAFASGRLAAPRYDRIEDARTVLLKNIGKLMRAQQRKPEVFEAIQQAAADGDFEQELVLLRRYAQRARQRHGVGER